MAGGGNLSFHFWRPAGVPHIYIDRGLGSLATRGHIPDGHVSDKPVRVFELGLGTGLNALLTLSEVETMQLPVYYEAVRCSRQQSWSTMMHSTP
ncbi:MAG: hypothetical protein BGO55_14575 [Sphingobacteriales bacterium 50-39]|nr:hypothetical protein [Sphingobacteriales bacterium]OJW57507.1 MAG: hypothetical protein BGO55_14575 [Sphingobacteriales bacterium 50-39]